MQFAKLPTTQVKCSIYSLYGFIIYVCVCVCSVRARPFGWMETEHTNRNSIRIITLLLHFSFKFIHFIWHFHFGRYVSCFNIETPNKKRSEERKSKKKTRSNGNTHVSIVAHTTHCYYVIVTNLWGRNDKRWSMVTVAVPHLCTLNDRSQIIFHIYIHI